MGTSFIVGVYGLYILLVGFNGNADKLISEVKTEKGFIPWLIAISVLAGLNGIPETKPIVKPFIVLALITLVLEKFPVLKAQGEALLNKSTHSNVVSIQEAKK
ncbi:MAG: hypothetical protein KGJ13_12150 [Patescibacteria group bacterium]|nr:hypothetical protein [Patescibacteria group bacterium]